MMMPRFVFDYSMWIPMSKRNSRSCSKSLTVQILEAWGYEMKGLFL